VIPVQPQPEPSNFDADVRQRGHAWLANNGIALNSAPPKSPKLPAYWSATNLQLWNAYSRTCAYLAIYFEWPTGASSTDHFVAKSGNAGAAYEWSNFRLSSLGPNRRKNKFDDVLDPIGLAPDTFSLNLVNGKIRPNPQLPRAQQQAARQTIRRLKLDSSEHREMRARHYSGYLQHKHLDFFRRHSPFVCYEAGRQGLL
jgi:uncharacterized protein (TIGR02646 family)